MAVVPTPACSDCYFAKVAGDRTPPRLLCFRNPPQVVREGDTTRTLHPSVVAFDWCGEFESRETFKW